MQPPQKPRPFDARSIQYADFLAASDAASDNIVKFSQEDARRHRILKLEETDPKRRFVNHVQLSYVLQEGKIAVYNVILGQFEVEVRVLLINQEEASKPGAFLGAGSFGKIHADLNATLDNAESRKYVQKSVTSSQCDPVMKSYTGVSFTKRALEDLIQELSILKLLSMFGIAPRVFLQLEFDIVCYNTTAVIFMELLQPLNFASNEQFTAFERIVKAKMLAMHKLGIIHKDIKPGNIMASLASDDYYFIDFGISQAVEEAPNEKSSTIVEGTYSFMCEQMRDLRKGPANRASANLFYNDFWALRKSLQNLEFELEQKLVQYNRSQRTHSHDSSRTSTSNSSTSENVSPDSQTYTYAQSYGQIVFGSQLSDGTIKQVEKQELLRLLLLARNAFAKFVEFEKRQDRLQPLRRIEASNDIMLRSNYAKLYGRGYGIYEALSSRQGQAKGFLESIECSVFEKSNLDEADFYKICYFRDWVAQREHIFKKIKELSSAAVRHEQMFELYIELLKTYTLSNAQSIKILFAGCQHMCLPRSDEMLLSISRVLYSEEAVSEDELIRIVSEYKKYEQTETREVETTVRVLEYCFNRKFSRCFNQLRMSLERFLKRQPDTPSFRQAMARTKLLQAKMLTPSDWQRNQSLLNESKELYDKLFPQEHPNRSEGLRFRAECSATNEDRLTNLRAEMQLLLRFDPQPKLRTILCASKMLELPASEGRQLAAYQLQYLLSRLYLVACRHYSSGPYRKSHIKRAFVKGNQSLLKFYCETDTSRIELCLGRLLMFLKIMTDEPLSKSFARRIQTYSDFSLRQVYFELGDDLNAALEEPLLQKTIKLVTQPLYQQLQDSREQFNLPDERAKNWEWMAWLCYVQDRPQAVSYLQRALQYQTQKVPQPLKKYLLRREDSAQCTPLLRQTKIKIFELHYKMSVYCAKFKNHQDSLKNICLAHQIFIRNQSYFISHQRFRLHYQSALAFLPANRLLEAAYHLLRCRYLSEKHRIETQLDLSSVKSVLERALKGLSKAFEALEDILNLSTLRKRLLRTKGLTSNERTNIKQSSV